ncbi:copper amine oxidase [Apiospora sp. TS-2023a]
MDQMKKKKKKKSLDFGEEEEKEERKVVGMGILRTGANYFGTPYREGVNLPLEALEPDLEKEYRSGEHRVTDLGINGSAAGMWFREP